MRIWICIFLLMKAALAAEVPDKLKDIGIAERLGKKVSIESLTFRDENGRPVSLGRFFKKDHPVLLNLVYYECPSLCNFVLNGLVKSLKALDWTPGKEFEIVTLSINPKESFELAGKLEY